MPSICFRYSWKLFLPVACRPGWADLSSVKRSGRMTWVFAGCTLEAKKPMSESARASFTASVGHRPKRLPRNGRIAVFSESGVPSSSLSAGTRPSGWIFMYSGVFCSPFVRSMRFGSYFSPLSSMAMWAAMEQAPGA